MHEHSAQTSGLIGRSPILQQVLRAAGLVASTDVTVLILGESGTGKELLAQYLHQHSPWSSGPFVAINCAAIPEHLLESELFGHQRGAFTGANHDYGGRIRAAAGGTLFLDEIGELSLPAQAKLLRFLESGEIHPVGAPRPIPVRTRLIAATHRDLPMLVAQQLFRADLYYRLQVVPLEMPALRERADDVLELFSHFARLAAARHGRELISLDRPALRQLQRYPWPGNVRELKNLAERLTILHGSDPMPLGLACLPAELRMSGGTPKSTGGPLVDTERQMLADALQQAQGNRSQAARLLGISRDTLVYRIRKYELA
ncbi:sigma-54 dependent transcriptional regulator [Thermithiobacillus plumbiphilus]|uniref:Sigma-54 dependent transcriptional regulator n=1 Tax=Thermithiobacillus plumbiphilus TaxID=1729899 RepID=A0ABU9D5S4_9PROT